MNKEDKIYSIFLLNKMKEFCLQLKCSDTETANIIYQIESNTKTLLEIIEQN